MGKPIDVATNATVGFIGAHVCLPASLLEVGCGAGDAALQLMDIGYQYTGIDTDADTVEKARKRGVLVQLAEWPDYECEPVDAIVFTRSLHHIHELEAAITRAKELLKPGGKLLVEDFAFDEVDDKTIDWFLQVINTPEACDLIQPQPDEFITHLLASDNPREAWRHDHDHELHTISVMKDAIERHFTVEHCVSAPYLYRYLVPVLPESSKAASFIERTLDAEIKAGEAGDITLIGRRMSAAQTS